jgi:nickel-dependent lactate racemase
MVKSFKIPWAAWRDPDFLEVSFPDSWDITNCRMNGADGPILTDDEIKQAILNPIGTPKISELAMGKETVVIVVDDMTRTTPVSKILPHVLEELAKANINIDHITILLALGAHKPMNRHDCILKLGKEVVDTINIENHHPYENLTHLGESEIGTPIDVNSTYVNADLKISIGGVIPHPLAGFGGGAKIVLPGVCGIRTLEANHEAGTRGIGAGIGIVTDIRRDIEDIADKVGLDFSINAILTESGEISAMTSGHFRDAHRKAMELALQNYGTKFPIQNQICFFNLFPEDSELNQSIKGFNFLITSPGSIIDRKGSIVLMSSSYEGKGYHSLMAETGAKLYKNYGEQILWKAYVRRKRVYFFSPNISERDLYHFYPKSVKLFSDWNKLIEELTKEHGDAPKAALFPCSIQLAEK